MLVHNYMHTNQFDNGRVWIHTRLVPAASCYKKQWPHNDYSKNSTLDSAETELQSPHAGVAVCSVNWCDGGRVSVVSWSPKPVKANFV